MYVWTILYFHYVKVKFSKEFGLLNTFCVYNRKMVTPGAESLFAKSFVPLDVWKYLGSQLQVLHIFKLNDYRSCGKQYTGFIRSPTMGKSSLDPSSTTASMYVYKDFLPNKRSATWEGYNSIGRFSLSQKTCSMKTCIMSSNSYVQWRAVHKKNIISKLMRIVCIRS